MTGISDYFSSGHERLLNIATWSKHIGRIVFWIFLLYAIVLFLQGRTNYVNSFGEHVNFWEMLTEKPIYVLSLVFYAVTTFFKGVVFYLVLEGVSLGLNMIVETNIDYREIQDMKDNEEWEVSNEQPA